jgi:glycosyltransferase involved in cell wall biosynthesis
LRPARMTKTVFSIVIPTYHAQESLKECLGALLDQGVNEQGCEIIVVNDGGDDEVREHIVSLGNGSRIRYLYQENKGPAAARNLGIENANGDVILFLDDDSLPTEKWFGETRKAWERHRDVHGIGGYVASRLSDGMCSCVNADLFNWFLDAQASGQHPNFLTTCNGGYQKSALIKVGNFDQSFKTASGEDRDLNLKIVKAGGKLVLDRSIIVYHDRVLSLRSFLKKHMNYGKAAYEIHQRYPDQRRMPRREYLDLFLSTIRRYRTCRQKIAALALVSLSQVATTVGYSAVAVRQWTASRKGLGRQ